MWNNIAGLVSDYVPIDVFEEAMGFNVLNSVPHTSVPVSDISL